MERAAEREEFVCHQIITKSTQSAPILLSHLDGQEDPDRPTTSNSWFRCPKIRGSSRAYHQCRKRAEQSMDLSHSQPPVLHPQTSDIISNMLRIRGGSLFSKDFTSPTDYGYEAFYGNAMMTPSKKIGNYPLWSLLGSGWKKKKTKCREVENVKQNGRKPPDPLKASLKQWRNINRKTDVRMESGRRPLRHFRGIFLQSKDLKQVLFRERRWELCWLKDPEKKQLKIRSTGTQTVQKERIETPV